MKKYVEIEKLTRKYLEGKLEKLTVLYKDNQSVEVDVVYLDEFHCRYRYDMLVDFISRDSNFLSHNGNAILCNINLGRETQFEAEVCKVITAVN